MNWNSIPEVEDRIKQHEVIFAEAKSEYSRLNAMRGIQFCQERVRTLKKIDGMTDKEKGDELKTRTISGSHTDILDHKT